MSLDPGELARASRHRPLSLSGAFAAPLDRELLSLLSFFKKR
jgi:hypothetical protein